jgi:hypothetical protein
MEVPWVSLDLKEFNHAIDSNLSKNHHHSQSSRIVAGSDESEMEEV